MAMLWAATGWMSGSQNRSRLCRLAGILQLAGFFCLCLAGLQAAPIRAHPANPDYFEFRGQPTLLITSAEHYGAVIYEISNEPFNNGVDPAAVDEWHRHIAAAIAKAEQALGVKHLVAANEAVHKDPNVSMLNWHYVANLDRLGDEYALGKPIVLDETNGSLVHAGVDDVRVEDDKADTHAAATRLRPRNSVTATAPSSHRTVASPRRRATTWKR